MFVSACWLRLLAVWKSHHLLVKNWNLVLSSMSGHGHQRVDFSKIPIILSTNVTGKEGKLNDA
jgi:hypothetical protein